VPWERLVQQNKGKAPPKKEPKRFASPPKKESSFHNPSKIKIIKIVAQRDATKKAFPFY
jgi:hypothetical protein